VQATYARCAAASKVPLPAVGYLCFLLTQRNLCPVRISKGGKSSAKAQKAKGEATVQAKAQGEAKGAKVVPVAPPHASLQLSRPIPKGQGQTCKATFACGYARKGQRRQGCALAPPTVRTGVYYS
jgi:hypothetical protein